MDIRGEISTSEAKSYAIGKALGQVKDQDLANIPLPWLERLGQTLALAIMLQTNLEILLAELPKSEAPPTCGHPMADGTAEPHGGWPVRDTTLPNVGEVESV